VYWSDMYLWDEGKGDGLVKWRKDSPSHILGENILGNLKFGASVERQRDGYVVGTKGYQGNQVRESCWGTLDS
jgi:hypothetical protein